MEISEETFVMHCSPTLAGIKTGNLFTCSFDDEREMKESIRRLNRILVRKGIRVLPLRYRNNRGLIYVYRPSKLLQDQRADNAHDLLAEYGYDGDTLEQRLIQLIQKLYQNENFPHEIGLFLGYPPEDVRGFIENKAEKYKFIGDWKVYGDEAQAKKRFAMFKKCKEIYCSQFAKGKSIDQLAVRL